MATKFYVLIHYRVPMFVGTDEENFDPGPFKTEKLAREYVEGNHWCRALGATILAWDDRQGGLGPVRVIYTAP